MGGRSGIPDANPLTLRAHLAAHVRRVLGRRLRTSLAPQPILQRQLATARWQADRVIGGRVLHGNVEQPRDDARKQIGGRADEVVDLAKTNVWR